MATTTMTAPGGAAAEAWLRERFGIQYGEDVVGIGEDGVNDESYSGGAGMVRIELVAHCTREDAERFVNLLWSKGTPS